MTSRLGQTLAKSLRYHGRPTAYPFSGSTLVRNLSLFPDIDETTFNFAGKEDDNKKRKKRSGKPSYRFVDRIRIKATAGDGGKGSLSMHKIGRKRKIKPDGGNGGNGGSVLIFADSNEQSLRMPHHHVQAPKGGNGDKQEKFGRKGKNSIIRVPCGVVVKLVLDYDERWDPETKTVTKINEDVDLMAGDDFFYQEDDGIEVTVNGGEDEDAIDPDMIGFSDWDVFEGDWKGEEDGDDNQHMDLGDRERVVLADLDAPSSHVVVARGGKGGYGSGIFASHHGKLPDAKILAKCARPQPGEVAFLELELKLIADIGLVGFPNAGKSSLLCAMSRAGPMVAPYPFTTLNPFIGVIEYRDAFTLKVADIPGLIEGAAKGVGLGHDFLRHLERTKALLYIVDAAGTEGRDPIEDLKILANELASYGDGDMMNRKALVVANKLDLLDEEEQAKILSKLAKAAQEMGIQVHGQTLGISAGVTGLGLGPLSQAMRSIVPQREVETST